MPDSTCSASWLSFLTSLSPALSAVLSAIALLVASRTRSTSLAALQTSQEANTRLQRRREQLDDSASPRSARGRKRS